MGGVLKKCKVSRISWGIRGRSNVEGNQGWPERGKGQMRGGTDNPPMLPKPESL